MGASWYEKKLARQQVWHATNQEKSKAQHKASNERRKTQGTRHEPLAEELIEAQAEAQHAARANRKNAQVRARYAANPARRAAIQEASKAYRATNPELLRAYFKAHRTANPDLYRTYAHKRRARQLGKGGNVTTAELETLRAKYGGKSCLYCGESYTKRNPQTIDHTKPLAKEGLHEKRNIQFICRSCNSSKGTKDPIEFARTKGKLL